MAASINGVTWRSVGVNNILTILVTPTCHPASSRHSASHRMRATQLSTKTSAYANIAEGPIPKPQLQSTV